MATRTHDAISGILMSALILVAASSLPAMTSIIPQKTSMQTIAYAAVEQTSPDSGCIDQTVNEMHSKASTLDNPKAIAMAVQNNEFKSKTQGFVTKFNSIFNNWSFDLANCHVSEWQTVNVVHSLYNANDGSYMKNIVVTLDPTLTQVVSVTEHVGAFYAHSRDTLYWAGYEFTGASYTYPTPPTSPNVWEAKATWTQPSVSVPTVPSNACRTDLGKQPCNLAIWTGLEDAFGAANTHIAQAGSDAKITCNPSCTTNYFFWYQIDTDNPATICDGTSFTAGHGVQAIVTNQKKTNGDPWKYNLSVIDTSTAVGCSTTGVSYTDMQSPVIAAFINERAEYNPPYHATLAKFSSDTITGTMYYNGASTGISTPYANGWYDRIRMVNSGTVNINYGTVSGNAITLTWSSSSNT